MVHVSAKVCILATAAWISGSTASFAETLTRAVQLALKNNPEVQALVADVKATGYGVDASEGLLGPSVTTSAAAIASTRESQEGWSASLSATQNIYDGGFSRGELHRSEAIHRATVSRLRESTAVGTLQATKAYMEVQRSRGVVRILAANLSSLKSLQHRVRLRVDAGVSNEVELFNTAAKIDAAKINLIDAKSQLSDAVAQFQITIGHLPGSLETVNAPVQLLPRSSAEAARLAQGYSPRIMAMRYDALAAEAVTESSAAAGRPKLDLSVSASHNDTLDKRYSDTSELSAQIAVRFDLYDGGTSAARVKQSKYNAIAARERTKAESNNVKLELATALNAVQIARQKVTILRSQLANTRQTFELSRKRYNAGVTPLSEILDLHTAVATAEASWLNAEFTYRYNVYRVLAGVGRMPRSLETKALKVASTQ